MSVAAVSIPESLYDRLKQLSEEQQITVEQFVVAAVAEKMSAVERGGYIAQRASCADDRKFAEALSQISDTEPEAYDKL